ncbi:MAG: YkgJ family cysteine cluster protein [Lachnospiraceae bacterium]|nr:YkgJ family cysteine cluster protein [Lachnospiraceae bacterium]
MERDVDMKEISDGKLYGSKDMVKADCQDCVGCWECCHGMGESIVLDPLDVFRLLEAVKGSFDGLVQKHLELGIVDGMVLPNLKMDEKTENCTFLDSHGRCSIHENRPGICRLFPLGRFYENRSFQYFLQVHECKKRNRVKIKVCKWIDTPDVKQYETFVTDWHYFLKDLKALVDAEGDEEQRRMVTMYVLKRFYQRPYDQGREFYPQFEERMLEAKQLFGLMTEQGAVP